MLTIDGVFRENVRRHRDSVALKYYQDRNWELISYDEMNNTVNTIAHGLYVIGIRRDSKIAIMCENRPEWMISYLAAITVGAIAVPIDAVLGEEETGHILKHSEASTIICSMKNYEMISRLIGDIDTLTTIIILNRNIIMRQGQKAEELIGEIVDMAWNKNQRKNIMSWEELLEHGTSRIALGTVEFPEKTMHDLTSILYTSGTTGSPKGVMLTHRNILSNVEAANTIIDVHDTDNFVLLLPLHHAFSFTTCMMLPLSYGAAVSFVDILSLDRSRLIMQCRPTIMIGVPLLYLYKAS